MFHQFAHAGHDHGVASESAASASTSGGPYAVPLLIGGIIVVIILFAVLRAIYKGNDTPK